MIPGATTYPQEFAERYKRSGLWRDQTLGELLQHSVQVFGERAAVGDEVAVFGPGSLGESSPTTLAEAIGTVGEEIMVRVSPLIPRVYV